MLPCSSRPRYRRCPPRLPSLPILQTKDIPRDPRGPTVDPTPCLVTIHQSRLEGAPYFRLRDQHPGRAGGEARSHRDRPPPTSPPAHMRISPAVSTNVPSVRTPSPGDPRSGRALRVGQSFISPVSGSGLGMTPRLQQHRQISLKVLRRHIQSFGDVLAAICRENHCLRHTDAGVKKKSTPTLSPASHPIRVGKVAAVRGRFPSRVLTPAL